MAVSPLIVTLDGVWTESDGVWKSIGRSFSELHLLAQALTDRPVKITLPGPVTIGNACADVHYGNDRKGRGADIAEALNAEIKALADAGCRYVQIDEPGFARSPEDALDFGFENLDRC